MSMLSSDDATQATGPMSRPPHRRDAASGRRQNILQQKNSDTDSLPRLNAEPPNSRIAWRQLIQLREENKRLRWELAELAQAKDGEAIHSGDQTAEQYQNQLQELTAERDSLKDAYFELERRYQQLHHTFQSSVEKEAQRMMKDAARTIVLDSESRPAMMNDAMKTVELHVRQLEDKHTAEALYLMRQAQKKAKELEYELAQEREQIAVERQNLHNLQQSAREQAELRKRVVEGRLRAQFGLALVLIAVLPLFLLPVFQIICLSLFHIHLTQQAYIVLFVPILACVAIAGFFAYLRSSARIITANTPHKHREKKKA